MEPKPYAEAQVGSTQLISVVVSVLLLMSSVSLGKLIIVLNGEGIFLTVSSHICHGVSTCISVTLSIQHVAVLYEC